MGRVIVPEQPNSDMYGGYIPGDRQVEESLLEHEHDHGSGSRTRADSSDPGQHVDAALPGRAGPHARAGVPGSGQSPVSPGKGGRKADVGRRRGRWDRGSPAEPDACRTL